MEIKRLEAQRNALVRLLRVPRYACADCQAYINAAINRIESRLSSLIWGVYADLRELHPTCASLIDDWYNSDGINSSYKVLGESVLFTLPTEFMVSQLRLVLGKSA